MDLKKLFSGSTDSTWVQFFRYIFVGGGATVVQYLILVFLTELFHMDPNLSAVFGFLGGLGRAARQGAFRPRHPEGYVLQDF